jgi:universal stress protein E
MPAIRRILVAADAGTSTAPGLAGAADLARRMGAALRLASGVYDPDIAGEAFPDSRERDAARDALVGARRRSLEELAGQLRGASELEVSVAARWSIPVIDAILAEAREYGADLLVLAARPRGGFRHSDWQLVAGSPCSVLITRGQTPAGYQKILVAVDPMHAHDKPAVLDDALIECASALAGPTQAALHLLHCYLPPEYLPFRAPGAVSPAVFHRGERSIGAHRAALQQLARRHGIPDSSCRLEPGDAREAIPDAVGRSCPDLVVMGVVARSRLRRFLIGSTAEAVLDRLDCDVLAVKPPAATAGI